ncbi:hypothetical protein BO99DRAFT_401068 [Aspergillus violaceofuscus CBS 115571]|uniref:Uncharacterized protein n=1 Tax=Aspergillus violaceofuscus (strain CBS 115571) TaxID=1450538 RepID=A0A2V5HFH3_ASPV1|nr:hypothetical protein BO99DRAFT_401068 [Aspergillus violaceofuscus CBS 115571]
MLPLFPPFPLGPTTPRSPYETSHTATQRSALTLWEFELLHHWILDVADSFDVSPGFHRAWRDQAIRAALQHEYLLHVILVLSALHLALTDSPSFTDRHRGLIVRGCSDAMATFRKEAEHVTEVNCHALMAFAFLVSVYAFALAQFDRADHHDHHCSHQPPPPPHRVDQDQEHKQQEQNILDETIGTLVLIKGTVVVGDSTKPLAEASGRPWVANADILAPPLGESASPSEDQDLHRALEDLQAWIDHAARGRGSGKHQGEEGGGPPTPTPRPITTTTSHQALRLLRETLAANLRSNLRPFAWPCTLDENYLDLLRARDPTALLILAHYAVILVQCRAQWWCAGWGARVIAGVAELLPEGLAGPLAYPLHVIGRG